MRFSLDVLRARKGDCFMVHYGSEDDPHLILIDGGPSGVYKPQLEPRLAKVHKALELQEENPLPVDVVMVSHVDDDHIAGILELTKDQRAGPKLRLKVGSLWHNGIDALLGTELGMLKAEAGFGAAAMNGTIDVGEHDEFDVAKVLASIPQGKQLQDDAKALDWKPNRAFGGKLILADGMSGPVSLKGGLKVTVVGPMQAELLALRKIHAEWLHKQHAQQEAGSQAVPAAFTDTAIPNLSSIVVLAELDGKRMLLTGDARGDKIMKGLELVGLLQPGGSMHVDLLKVPHHGSARNMRVDFFERVTAEHYVFSGDGKNGNPDRETVEMLLEARPEASFTIHLTYHPNEIDPERKKDWEKQQAREKAKQTTEHKTDVRQDWSHEGNSLEALLPSKLSTRQTLSVVVADKPHLIDLLAPTDLSPVR